MKFLLDACVSSRTLISFLTAEAHDVLSVLAIDPRCTDERLLDQALREDRVLLTEDKDFGELVFVTGRLHGPIVRLVELSVAGQVHAIRELLEQHAHELTGKAIITVTRGWIRIRR